MRFTLTLHSDIWVNLEARTQPVIFLLPNISVNLRWPDEASEAASSQSKLSRDKEALTFTLAFRSTQWKPTASTPLPSLSVRIPVTAEAPQHVRRPSTNWTLSFGLGAKELVSNGSHGAQRNFQRLTSPLNDRRATQRRGVLYFLFPYWSLRAIVISPVEGWTGEYAQCCLYAPRASDFLSFLCNIVCV